MNQNHSAVPNYENWFERVPKVELHLHLEGAIPLNALWELVQKYGGEPSVPDLEALRHRFIFRDFPHFIDTWIWKNQFLREYEDFTFIAEAVARDQAGQNIRYAEVFFSAPDFARYGLKTQELARAIRKGLERVPGIEVALVADLVRDFGPERAAITLAEVQEARDSGIIGIGIGGSEQLFPPGPFAKVYEKARQLGFHTTAHAGEVAGAESVWEAIRELKVERIGHGVRAAEDESLMDYLAAAKIPLEVCPLSNLRTGAVKSIDELPVRVFFERGLVFSVNSDDPKMFGNSLAGEYRLLHDFLGFSKDEIRFLILQGIRGSWLPEERKRQMSEEFCNDVNWFESADI